MDAKMSFAVIISYLIMLEEVISIVPAVNGFTGILFEACNCCKECKHGDSDKVMQLVNSIIIAN